MFEQLAKFSSARSNAHRSEAAVPHRGGEKQRPPPLKNRTDCIAKSALGIGATVLLLRREQRLQGKGRR